jgi:hypothetical protein
LRCLFSAATHGVPDELTVCACLSYIIFLSIGQLAMTPWEGQCRVVTALQRW